MGGKLKYLILLLALVAIHPAFAQSSGVRRGAHHRYAMNAGDMPSRIQGDTLTPLYHYTEAVKAISIHRDSTRALRLLHKAIEQDSTFAPAHYELASYYLDNNLQKSMYHAEKAFLRDTTNRWYTGIYAQTLAVSGNNDKALPLYRRMIKEDKSNPDHYRILALLYQQRQQPYSAIEVLDSAEMRFGKIAYMTNLKRHLLIKTNQGERAISEAEQAVEEAPYDVDNILSLGQTYRIMGNDSLAKVNYERAIKTDSTNLEALLTYANFCSDKADYRGYFTISKRIFAIEEFPIERKLDICDKLTRDRNFYGQHYYAIGSLLQTLMLYNPNHKQVVELYANHLIGYGDVEAALALFKSHLEDEPPQLDYYMAVIDGEDYLERPDSVDYYVQRAMERFPGDPTLVIRRANRNYIKGDLKGAIDDFKEALTLTENDTLQGQVWGYVGDTYYAIAERRMALQKAKIKRDTAQYPIRMKSKKALTECFAAYDKALALYPDNAMVLNNYAYFLSEQRRELERALDYSARAIVIEQNNATYLDTHAWVLYCLGKYEQARGVMRKALMLDTTGSEVLMLHYGDINFALGDDFMAQTYWQKALDAGASKEEVAERMARLALKQKKQTQEKE